MPFMSHERPSLVAPSRRGPITGLGPDPAALAATGTTSGPPAVIGRAQRSSSTLK